MTTPRVPDAPPAVRRQLPRWSQLRPLLGFQAPALGTQARLARAATIDDLRDQARRHTPRSVFDYTDGAADDESSLTRSRELYARAEFAGQVLNDIAAVDLSTTILGEQVSMPLVLGPTGFTRMMNHEGETAVAHEARRAQVAYSLSTMGTTPLERVAEVSGPNPHWFQLYLWQDRPASIELIERARESGYSALVVTVDTAVAGNRLRDVRNGLTIPPKLTPKTFLDMATHPGWWGNLLTTEPLEFASLSNWEGTVAEMINKMFDPSVTWDDVAWLRGMWPGKVVLKGIQSAEDAVRAFDLGVDAVLISQHGGRQIGRGRPPLRVLPEVREAVGGEREVFVDGGVMSGADVVAALAHGADSVWVGRAYLYGLMAGGHLGVRRALEIFRSEITRTMQLLGVSRIADLRPEYVRLPVDPTVA
ncbi:alpha-hydroxy acid oxidase [Enemella evansiae]|uniref:alpha-hydroxy acid oxidase n=1 Tax=Enemella evansiae TaxID=2016499 RepID=UPI000B9635DB|nr:alpha-hydroxy acid oxidase [Enemella evansiae]OYO03555.1 alpha-hydroxy-acid oxidizing enzyme [Enemella evansiae]